MLLLLAGLITGPNFIDDTACRSNEEINAAMEKSFAAAKEKITELFPRTTATVSVTFNIEKDGKITTVEARTSPKKNEKLENFVTSVTKNARFSTKDCGPMEVRSYPVRVDTTK